MVSFLTFVMVVGFILAISCAGALAGIALCIGIARVYYAVVTIGSKN